MNRYNSSIQSISFFILLRLHLLFKVLTRSWSLMMNIRFRIYCIVINNIHWPNGTFHILTNKRSEWKGLGVLSSNVLEIIALLMGVKKKHLLRYWCLVSAKCNLYCNFNWRNFLHRYQSNYAFLYAYGFTKIITKVWINRFLCIRTLNLQNITIASLTV